MINPNAPQWYHELPAEYISQDQFNQLREYSCSLPTGTTIGKTWKRNLIAYVRASKLVNGDRTPVWVLCRYVSHSDPGLVAIESFQLRIKGERIQALLSEVIAQEGQQP